MEKKKSKYNNLKLKTYVAFGSHKISQFLKEKNFHSFVIVGVLAFILYHVSLPFNITNILVLIFGTITNLFDIQHFYDESMQKVIITIVSSLTIIVSLLSAIYVFTHREQKGVSPSASTNSHKNTKVTLVIGLMIFILIFGYLIVRDYSALLNESNYVPSLVITKQLFSRILFWFFLLFCFAYLIVEFIKYLFRTMSVDSMLEDSVKHSSKLFDDILHTYRSKKFEAFLDNRYREFHFSLESVFQNLKFAADNNMNKEFEENIENFKVVINKMKQKYDTESNIHVSTYLLTNDGAKFTNAYNSALRSNLALISTLMKNSQYNKAKKAVSLYFCMFLDSDEKLTKIFKISSNDFLDFIDTSDERQLLIFLEGLNDMPKNQTLITYKFLLMKLINKDQIRNLTNLVYDAFNRYTGDRMLKGHILGIFLQSLIKSIEISNYSISRYFIRCWQRRNKS